MKSKRRKKPVKKPVRRPRTLFLVRHAIAGERGPKYPDDSLRPLTRQGREKMRAAAKGFARIAPRIDAVVSSPLVRAKQTAEILIAELDPAPEHFELEELAPDSSPGELADALSRYAGKRTIALVGHEPDLGQFAAWLIGAGQPIEFKKGGIACFDVADFPPGRTSCLRWAAPPKMLRALKKK